MNVHLWIGFVGASLVVGLIPGPGVMSIVGYALGSGCRTALASVAGMAVGNLVAMSLSMAGVGALLAASALAFAVLKWAGALYLIVLGAVAIARSHGPVSHTVPRTSVRPRVAFASNAALGTFHPKTIVFFVAFAPQFVSPDVSYAVQATVLVATSSVVVGCTDTLYAVVAARASKFLTGPGAERWTRRVGGGVLIAAGLATAAARD